MTQWENNLIGLIHFAARDVEGELTERSAKGLLMKLISFHEFGIKRNISSHNWSQVWYEYISIYLYCHQWKGRT